MTYAEELGTSNPRHPARITVRTAVNREGKMIAHQSRALFDGGAYAGAKPMPGLMVPTGFGMLQAYEVPNTSLEVIVAYTNSVPSGHMRAPGGTIAALAGEEHIDGMARELGIDPIDFRLRNALKEGVPDPAGNLIANPRVDEVLAAIKRETDWGKPLPPNRGRGIAVRHRDVGQGKTEILLKLREDGKIEAVYGTPDQGSGSATVVRRVTAAILNVAPERIMVRYGTTSEAPPDPGAGASRVTHIMGRAAILASQKLKEQLEELASEVMGWPAGRVSLDRDRFVVGDSGESAGFEEVASRIARGGNVEARGQYDSMDHPPHDPEDTCFYACMVEVEVDPDTGKATPIQAVMAVDVGTIINPIAHQGQLEGSFVYGMGNAMMEEMAVEDGRITTLSLGEYKLPTEMDIPPLRTILLPTPVGPGPFGAKAAGETTNSGVAPAFANAVTDAVGVRIKDLPITSERIFAALQAKRNG
jgi:CO/xanthine dehydrogenase Mo-binding subunit